jgi:hypothetical protein
VARRLCIGLTVYFGPGATGGEDAATNAEVEIAPIYLFDGEVCDVVAPMVGEAILSLLDAKK